MKPVFYLLAGPNGAGKSTLYKALLAAKQIPTDAEFVNADLYEAGHLQHITDAAKRSESTETGRDFGAARHFGIGLDSFDKTIGFVDIDAAFFIA